MTPGERVSLFKNFWPAACLANEWDVKDDAKRHAVVLDCMRQVGGPLVTTSSPQFGRDEATALFCYLDYLGHPADFDKSARWDTCKQDYHTYNRARQADWHERKLYGKGKNKLDRDRFAGATSASGDVLDELDPLEVKKRHITMAHRHQKKMREEAKKAQKPAQAGQIPAGRMNPAPMPKVPEELPF